MDEKTVIHSIRKTKCAVSAEEHNKFGGLGESIAHILGQNIPAPLEMVAVNDTFGESGTPEELMKKYGLDAENIVAKAERAISRKKS